MNFKVASAPAQNIQNKLKFETRGNKEKEPPKWEGD